MNASHKRSKRSLVCVQTGPENVPVLIRQRNHAQGHGQTDREMLFESLVSRATEESA